MEQDLLQPIGSFLKNLDSLQPVPTFQVPCFRKDEGIRVILFDIYGTLLISASGDIDEANISSINLLTAFEKAGIEIVESSEVGERAILSEILDDFQKSILADHALSRQNNIPFPEIDIEQIWEGVINRMKLKGNLKLKRDSDIRMMTFVFEILSNRVYPMPGMKPIIQNIYDSGLPMGIISNAQFYTPVIMNYFLNGDLKDSDHMIYFEKDLTVFSYRHLRAKPDPCLFSMLLDTLRNNYDVLPEQVLFLGNDMYKDIYPAKKTGFKTALFAGDKRSLRLRIDQPEIKSLAPDFIITELEQLLNIIC